jgi:DNA mismatch repair protein MutS
VERARIVLEALEKGEREGGATQKALIDDLPLFSAVAAAPAPKAVKASEIEAKLEALLPDEMTPREALDTLYSLKALLTKKGSS